MTATHLFVDFHALQDLPPSNINRDDQGTPKQAHYGGVDRLRVSSQAWKRATRKHFADTMEPADVGVRTKRLSRMIADRLVEQGVAEADAVVAAGAALTPLGIKPNKKKADETSYLLFLSRANVDAIAAALLDRRAAWEGVSVDAATTAVKDLELTSILGGGHSLDVALFGRMVADLASLNVDAACQVAHALSTHAAPTQFDYFTAVDDLTGDDESGAGMLGFVEYNSATMYRYATVSVDQLVENLSDPRAAVEALEKFLVSFAESMPTGHQNSFAARTLPSFVMLTVRGDHPVSYVSAFEKPVSSASGFMDASASALVKSITASHAMWGDEPELTTVSHALLGDAASAADEALGVPVPFAESVARVRHLVAERLGV